MGVEAVARCKKELTVSAGQACDATNATSLNLAADSLCEGLRRVNIADSGNIKSLEPVTKPSMIELYRTRLSTHVMHAAPDEVAGRPSAPGP